MNGVSDVGRIWSTLDLKIKYKILFGMWIIIVLLSIIFYSYIYTKKKAALLNGIDEKLYTSAVMLRSVVGENFHDELSQETFTKEHYNRVIVVRNNNLCRTLDLQYLWSNMVVENNIVFTTSTSPGHDVTKRDHAGFFTVHTDPHAFDEVFKTMKPTYSSFHNEWGHGRMVLVPYTDKNGRPYVFGSSISTNEVYVILHRTKTDTLIFCGIALILGTIITFIVSSSFSTPIVSLSESINNLSKGEFDTTIDSKMLSRRDEVGDLARDFDLMLTNLEKVTASRDELDREISMRQQTEAVLRESESNLARQKRLLEEVNTRLLRSNEDLEKYAYVASHDLREPLRSISGFLQMLQMRYDSKLDDEGRSLITRAVGAAARLNSLILGLLEYSRLNTRETSFEAVDCGQALASAEANLETAISESGAAITHDPLPTVNGDPDQLVQLFQNLLANGIKFCRDRTPEIHIKAEQQKDGWKFSVQDNGIGIDPQYHHKIFQMFQRLHARDKLSGTGIGLPICQRIVERHGGSISVDSEVGQGTTFHFTIAVNTGS